jgi:hypothetical protein
MRENGGYQKILKQFYLPLLRNIWQCLVLKQLNHGVTEALVKHSGFLVFFSVITVTVVQKIQTDTLLNI